ncbi:hypothetical protein, partial [Pseudonocardia sp. SID8383]|uniref:hypothetical protein n=1 Tax=Pseudonocardia sp. SID8383 TaxID=2690363 RepID=UPI001F23B676
MTAEDVRDDETTRSGDAVPPAGPVPDAVLPGRPPDCRSAPRAAATAPAVSGTPSRTWWAASPR